MKHTYLYFGAILAALLMQSCSNRIVGDGQQLLVERQERVLNTVGPPITINPFDIGFAADVPTSGSQVLVDSVMAYLNKELYEYFTYNDSCFVPYNPVPASDRKNLLKHFRDVYKSLDADGKNLLEKHFLEIYLVAQTDSYVTYEADWSYYGEGIETFSRWTTFSKRDGHIIKNIIIPKNLLRFMAENPDKRNSDVWLYVKPQNYEDEIMSDEVGLLNDSVVHQYQYATGIFEIMKYDMKSILPYLTEETQKIVNNK